MLSPLNDGSLLRASLSASTGSLLCQIVFIGNKKTTLGVFNAAAKVHPRGAISIRMIGEARPSHTDSQKKTERCWERQAPMDVVCDVLKSDVDCRSEGCSLWDNGNYLVQLASVSSPRDKQWLAGTSTTETFKTARQVGVMPASDTINSTEFLF